MDNLPEILQRLADLEKRVTELEHAARSYQPYQPIFTSYSLPSQPVIPASPSAQYTLALL